MKNKKRIRAAYHEAGHVVAHYLLEGNLDKADSVDIVETEGRGGQTKARENAYRVEDAEIYEKFGAHEYYHTIADLAGYETAGGIRLIINYVCGCLSGGVSEMLFCGLKRLPKKGMGQDFEDINQLAYHDVMPSETDRNGVICYPSLNSLIETCVYILKSLLTAHSYMVKEVAEALLEKETLDRKALCEILNTNNTGESCPYCGCKIKV